MGEYVSYSSHGVDTKKFYDEFCATIVDVSRATGASRASVTRMAVEHASRQNTEKIVLYLEEISMEDYNFTIQQCTDELKDVIEKVKEAWKAYEKKEKILDKYRYKYGIKRRKMMSRRVTIWEILRRVIKAQ